MPAQHPENIRSLVIPEMPTNEQEMQQLVAGLGRPDSNLGIDRKLPSGIDQDPTMPTPVQFVDPRSQPKIRGKIKIVHTLPNGAKISATEDRAVEIINQLARSGISVTGLSPDVKTHSGDQMKMVENIHATEPPISLDDTVAVLALAQKYYSTGAFLQKAIAYHPENSAYGMKVMQALRDGIPERLKPAVLAEVNQLISIDQGTALLDQTPHNVIDDIPEQPAITTGIGSRDFNQSKPIFRPEPQPKSTTPDKKAGQAGAAQTKSEHIKRAVQTKSEHIKWYAGKIAAVSTLVLALASCGTGSAQVSEKIEDYFCGNTRKQLLGFAVCAPADVTSRVAYDNVTVKLDRLFHK